jgi:cell fate regulator YaaT (PSP1 superfamily)
MACTSCATSDKTGVPKGCGSQGTCSSGGCNKLGVFDWLAGMRLPQHYADKTHWVEVRFKNERKEIFANPYIPNLFPGELITVEGDHGYDIGRVSLTGELVRVQMKKKAIDPERHKLRKILRRTTPEEFEKWQQVRLKEEQTMLKTRMLAKELRLEMKVSDVEYQADGAIATFFYIAEDRVDFRELIKVISGTFGIRVMMRQIGSRQEAAKVGGIGSCGRELCCSTWLTDFRTVNTTAARYQQLSINPQKLTGQCGKLKCCLNYELDMYVEAFGDFLEIEIPLLTQEGKGVFFKADVLKRQAWYHFTSSQGITALLPVEPALAKTIASLNKQGIIPASLEAVRQGHLDGQGPKNQLRREHGNGRFDPQKTKEFISAEAALPKRKPYRGRENYKKDAGATQNKTDRGGGRFRRNDRDTKPKTES